MFVHAPSGAASFAACMRLFRSYPLAVNPPRAATGWQPSVVLRHRGFEGSGYYLLTQDPAEHFTLRPWHPGEGACHRIRPARPVPVTSHRVITEGMPVPRDGALLGWVSDRQTTVLLSAYQGRRGLRSGLPQIRVLAHVGSEPVRWPPFTASPLDDGRLWEYVERGELVDVAPLVDRGDGDSYWVPSQNCARAREGHGCAVIGQNLATDDYWVPAGIYMDHWMLREGVPTPPASHLLTLPGVSALGGRLAAC